MPDIGARSTLGGNGDLDLDAGLDVDNDRLDELGGRGEINQAWGLLA